VSDRDEHVRAESLTLGGVSTMPKLNQMSWQVYRKPAANGSSIAVPVMLLSLVLGEGQTIM
jgi:hypothetical protein